MFVLFSYIGPALTAPHYYGLLLEAPNQVAQRQLVLIAKVLQTLANMATNNKEAYMENLSDFMNRNKPKVAEFYRSILVSPIYIIDSSIY